MDYQFTNKQFDLTQLQHEDMPYLICDLSATSSEESEQIDNRTAKCMWTIGACLVTLINPDISNPFADIDTLSRIKVAIESRNIDSYPIEVTTVSGVGDG